MTPRKHVTLTLDQKIEIIKLKENGLNNGMIAETCGIGKSSVDDIKKKNKDKIMKLVSTTERGLGTRQIKTARKSCSRKCFIYVVYATAETTHSDKW